MTNAVTGTLLAAALACAAHAQQPLTVELVDPEAVLLGTATLTQAPAGVTIALELTGLMPGEHALHLHAVPECKGFSLSSAGDHFNPTNKKHGVKNPEGPHAGDLGNVTVAANGTAKTTITATGITLAADAPNSVFAKGGTALILHEGHDDLTTDPEGGAGARLACGAVSKSPLQHLDAPPHRLTFVPIWYRRAEPGWPRRRSAMPRAGSKV
jgi:Cu-Zn family superoxide dismutase